MGTLKEFVSRRNSVLLQEDGAGLSVRKVFSDRADFLNETMVYSLVEQSGLTAPRVIAVSGSELILTYLPGINYVDVLERQEAAGAPDFAPWEALARWLYDFQRRTGLVMADMNLRNFIFNEETGLAAGLDFEQCRRGELEEMAAGLCAYTLLYFPEMSGLKKSISAHMRECFSEEYACSPARLSTRIDACVSQIQSMRRAKRGERAG